MYYIKINIIFYFINRKYEVYPSEHLIIYLENK